MGDSKLEVFLACGEPLTRTVVSYREIRKNDVKELIPVEQWFYDTGTGGVIHVLTFEGATLKDISFVRK